MGVGSLLVITQSYPFGHRTDFLEDEIEHLARHFDRVTVAPVAPSGPRRTVPDGVHVDLGLAGSTSRTARLTALLSRSSWRPLVRELTAVSTSRHPTVLPRAVLAVGLYLRVLEWARAQEAPTVAYTYWLTPATAALRDAWTGTPLVSRAHGGDLFAERHRPAVIPMQRESIAAADVVASVSIEGARYLIRKYPDLGDRVTVRRLGTVNPRGVAPASADGVVRLVSVSSLTPVKRPELLAMGIVELARRHAHVRWTHFGEGPLRSTVEGVLERADAGSLTVDLRGFVEPDRLLEELTSGPWDAFVNVSSSEGVPVSIMEALSAGIPVVATDVGGTAEVVDPALDQLLSSDPSPVDIADAIDEAISSGVGRRERRRSTWAARYDAARNYDGFAAWLASLPSQRGDRPVS